MQSITIPFAIQKENSTQEIITKKIPIKLLAAKIKQEAEWESLHINIRKQNFAHQFRIIIIIVSKD